jgi:hypothetical protein
MARGASMMRGILGLRGARGRPTTEAVPSVGGTTTTKATTTTAVAGGTTTTTTVTTVTTTTAGGKRTSRRTQKTTTRTTGRETPRGGGSSSSSAHDDDDDKDEGVGQASDVTPIRASGENFRSALLDQGRIVLEMEADGNCLFRSLSDQLYGDGGEMHRVVRREVCDYLSRNGEEFGDFLLIDDDDEDVSGLDGYVERMKQDGRWGGNVEVVVASRAYGRTIIVFSSEYSNGALSIGREDDDDEDGDGNARRGPPLMLSYHGNHHYNSVRSVDDASDGDNARRPARGGADREEDDGARESAEDEEEGDAGGFIGRFRVLTI